MIISNLLNMEKHNKELYMTVELNYNGDLIRTIYYRLNLNENNEVVDGDVYRITGIVGDCDDEEDTLFHNDFEAIHLFSNTISLDSLADHVQFVFEQYKEEINEFLKRDN